MIAGGNVRAYRKGKTMKTRILAMIATTTALGTGAAYAGSADQGYVEPAPIAPAPVAVAPVSDWTGPYVGLSFGNLSSQTGNLNKDGAVYGIYGGYDYDFGDVVVGGEVDFQAGGDYELGGVDVDNVTRIKARAGYDFGNTLVYGTAGVARIDSSIGDANGPVGGVGFDYRVTDGFSIGGEALAHRFEDVGGTGTDVDAQTYSLRGTFRF